MATASPAPSVFDQQTREVLDKVTDRVLKKLYDQYVELTAREAEIVGITMAATLTEYLRARRETLGA